MPIIDGNEAVREDCSYCSNDCRILVYTYHGLRDWNGEFQLHEHLCETQFCFGGQKNHQGCTQIPSKRSTIDSDQWLSISACNNLAINAHARDYYVALKILGPLVHPPCSGVHCLLPCFPKEKLVAGNALLHLKQGLEESQTMTGTDAFFKNRQNSVLYLYKLNLFLGTKSFHNHTGYAMFYI